MFFLFNSGECLDFEEGINLSVSDLLVSILFLNDSGSGWDLHLYRSPCGKKIVELA